MVIAERTSTTAERTSTAAEEWSCGCIAGRRLCGEAVRLWKETDAAFRQARPLDDFSDYKSACRAFDRHYEAQEAGG